MTCEACLAAFAVSPDKVDAVNKASSEVCGCEQFSVSHYSPGPVMDDEVLHFLVYTPEGRSENGKLNPALLMQADKEGLSTLRGGAGDEEFEDTMDELRPRWATKDRLLDGVVTFPVASVRYKDGGRFCCVYDTGLPRKPWHADIMLPSLSAESASMLKRLRYARLKQLVDLIGDQFTTMDVFRDGRLAHIGTGS
jgi:hypothetical protein